MDAFERSFCIFCLPQPQQTALEGAPASLPNPESREGRSCGHPQQPVPLRSSGLDRLPGKSPPQSQVSSFRGLGLWRASPAKGSCPFPLSSVL